jgi:hypothetical protein
MAVIIIPHNRNGTINRDKLIPAFFTATISLKFSILPAVNSVDKRTAIGVIRLMISGMK